MEDSPRVLVIDDDADVLTTMRLFLQSRGFEVITADGPEEGFQRLEQDRPDAVILDIMMPTGLEGFKWVWKLRRHEDAGLRDVPVVVVTSLHGTTSFRFHEGDADETGDYLPVQGFFDKPVDPDKLAEKIRSVLGHDA